MPPAFLKMTMVNKHFGKVEEGKFLPNDPKSFREAFYHHEGKPVEVSVKRKTRSRSNQQHRYYWGVVVKILGDHFGYSDLEMHEALKYEFLRIEKQGKPLTVRSTRDLTTIEFEDYVERIKLWSVEEYQCYIPAPGMIDLDG